MNEFVTKIKTESNEASNSKGNKQIQKLKLKPSKLLMAKLRRLQQTSKTKQQGGKTGPRTSITIERAGKAKSKSPGLTQKSKSLKFFTGRKPDINLNKEFFFSNL